MNLEHLFAETVIAARVGSRIFSEVISYARRCLVFAVVFAVERPCVCKKGNAAKKRALENVSEAGKFYRQDSALRAAEKPLCCALQQCSGAQRANVPFLSEPLARLGRGLYTVDIGVWANFLVCSDRCFHAI